MTTRDLPLLGRWIAARVRMMMRSPRALGFTFAFPLVLVTLFGSLNADQKVTAPSGATVEFTQYYTPSIGVFALTLACYTSLIIGVATARETGLLKRVRGTPLPLPVYLGAWLIGAGVVGILSVVLLFVVAVPAFGVHVYATCCRRRCWCSCWARRASARSGSRSGRWRRPPTRRPRSRS